MINSLKKIARFAKKHKIKVAIETEGSYEKKPNVLEQIAYRDTWGQGQDSFLNMIYENKISNI